MNAPLVNENSVSAKSSKTSLRSFIDFWNIPLLSYPRFHALLALVILGVCWVRVYVGLWGSRIYTHDAFSMLDGAWRVLHGQRPHVDFYTGLGPVTYLITAVGLLAAKGKAAGLAYGQALVGCTVGSWTYFLSIQRLRSVATTALCILLVLTAIVPTTIGDPPSWITPATTYNRFSYAFVALLMIEAISEVRRNTERSHFWGGASTGFVLGILLFLKISFFMGAVFLLLALAPMRKQTKPRCYGILAAFGFTVLAFAWYLRFDVMAVYSDLQTVAHSKHVMAGGYLIKDALMSACPFLLLVYLVAREVATPNRRAILFAGSAVCFIGFFFILTSWQFYGLPLDSVMAVLLVESAVPKGAHMSSVPAPRLSVLLFGVFFALSYILSETEALQYALLQKIHHVPYAAFKPAALEGFNSTVEKDYVEYINEGCGLLEQHRNSNDTVMALDFTNPFSFALGMRPSAGGTTWLQYGSNFDEQGPPPERVFGNATLVMLPKLFSDITLPTTVPRIYGPFLKKHYVLAAESLNWWMYRRKDSDQSNESLNDSSKGWILNRR